MKIFLDDNKSAPDNTWERCYSVNELTTFLQYINMEDVEEISLDCDLGKKTAEGGSGVQAVAWMVENKKWPRRIKIHDRSGKSLEKRQTMENLIRKYGARV